MAGSMYEEDFNDVTLRQFECPICFGYCTPPILQCANGHNVCSTCRARITACAICRGPITTVRNLFAEQMSERVRYPCPHMAEGCPVKQRLTELEQHVLSCIFRVKCYIRDKSLETGNNKLNQCTWKGKYAHLIDHVENVHPTWIGKSEMVYFSASLKKTQFLLISAFDELFWCILTYDFKLFSQQGHVCLLGSEVEATKYKYEFRLRSKGNECEIVNRGRVVAFNESLLPGYFLDESGNNIIVQGEQMVKRFIEAGNFKCCVNILEV